MSRGRLLLHVLVLNEYYPPDTCDTAAVVEDLVSTLAGRHAVTVLAGRPSYDPQERHPYYLWRREQRKSITVERVGSVAFHRRRMAGRVVNYLSYVGLALLRAPFIGADVIVAMTDPPLIGVVGVVAARLRRCALVYNIRDLHPDMALAAGMLRPGLIARLLAAAQRLILRHADLVVVLGPDMQERVRAKGVPEDRIAIVRNGSGPLPAPAADDAATVRLVRGDARFVLVHAGNLGFSGAWETILGAADRLRDAPVQVVFVGDGAARAGLEAAVRARRLSNVRFESFQPAERTGAVLRAADLHLVTVRTGLEGLVVPGKIYPVLRAGRPVLAIAARESDAAGIVQELGCGLVVKPDDSDAVAEAIRWAATHSIELAAMAERARAGAARFDRQGLLDRFVALVEATARGRRPAGAPAPAPADES